MAVLQISHRSHIFSPKSPILSNFSQFVFPFATIIISYSSIVVKLRERSLSGKPGSRYIIDIVYCLNTPILYRNTICNLLDVLNTNNLKFGANTPLAILM